MSSPPSPTDPLTTSFSTATGGPAVGGSETIPSGGKHFVQQRSSPSKQLNLSPHPGQISVVTKVLPVFQRSLSARSSGTRLHTKHHRIEEGNSSTSRSRHTDARTPAKSSARTSWSLGDNSPALADSQVGYLRPLSRGGTSPFSSICRTSYSRYGNRFG